MSTALDISTTWSPTPLASRVLQPRAWPSTDDHASCSSRSPLTCLSVAVARAERQLNVANDGTNKLTINDYIHGRSCASLPTSTCESPAPLAVQPGGSNRVLLEDGEVWSINGVGLTRRRSWWEPVLPATWRWSPNGSWLWIAELDPGVVTRLNTGNGNEQDIVAPLRPDGSAPGAPRHIALGEGGTKVYVASSDGVLWRIDIATMTVEYLHDFGTAIADSVMSVDGRDVSDRAQQLPLLLDSDLSMCSAQQCNPDDIMLANSPRNIVIDPGLVTRWPLDFVSDGQLGTSVRQPQLPLQHRQPGGPGARRGLLFFPGRLADNGFDLSVPHFAAGPYNCIQQPTGSQPVAVAFGPENNVIRATPGSWRFAYSELRDTLPRTLELKNVSKEIVRITALELVGENKDGFSVNSGMCGNHAQALRIVQDHGVLQTPQAGVNLQGRHLPAQHGEHGHEQLALVCAPALKKK